MPEPGGPAPDADRRSGGPLTTVAAMATLVYVVLHAIDLIVLGFSPTAFNALHRASAGIGPRLGVAVLGLAVLFHAADGLGRALIDLRPSLARHRLVAEALARFVTLAVGIPGMAVVVWPAVRAWWVR